jgi:multidrug efflux pump subunit AcrB
MPLTTTTTRPRDACWPPSSAPLSGHPRIVTALACLIAALGAAALISARFDVFPDFAPPHVLVQTEAPGLDATQVEALVTRPLEDLLAGTENVKTVRSTSSQGLSAMQVVFDRTGDPYRQRQVVTERLAETAGVLPRASGAPLIVALELFDGIPGALRLHQRPAVAAWSCATSCNGS